MTLAIRCRDVNKRYRQGTASQAVLDTFSMEVKAGESLALLGRSGSGKSTLLALLAGLDSVDSGEIFLGTFDIARAREPALTRFRRRHIGFVYQSFNLLPTLSVLDNVRLMLDLNGVSGREAIDRASTALADVGLDAASHRRPDTLSGGEQQRVAIARALVHRPGLILADEPTGNLDAGTADDVATLLTSLVRDSGMTLVMATHSPTLASACQRQLTLAATPRDCG